MFIPSENTIIGTYKTPNGSSLHIEFKYVFDLTQVYVPQKKNGIIVNMVYIYPEYISHILYKWFVENVIDSNLKNKKEQFYYWMCSYLKQHFPKINESNWRVYILKLS